VKSGHMQHVLDWQCKMSTGPTCNIPVHVKFQMSMFEDGPEGEARCRCRKVGLIRMIIIMKMAHPDGQQIRCPSVSTRRHDPKPFVNLCHPSC
jgi:hypothetical protein